MSSIVASAIRPPERVVLVVEDDDAVREVTVRILNDAGLRALEAGDGAEALSVLERLGPHVVWLVMSDIVIPRVTGNDLAKIVAHKWPAMQILLFSAQAGPHPGFTGSFLQKPFPPDELVTLVRALKVPVG